MGGMIQQQPFGPTGHDSTRVIFGAAAIGNVSQQEADQTMELIRAHGINHIDTAASYGDAELRLGPWMKAHRDEFFLATKTGERTRALAFEEIERSLERLRTDHVDLIQLHNLVDPDEWETAFAGGGAIEAVIEAQAEGLVRYIGVTGHGVTVARQHLRSLEQYPFDAVLLPYNYPMSLNAAYLAEFSELATVCAERGVALQTIKAITRGPWGEQQPTANTWPQQCGRHSPVAEGDRCSRAVYPAAQRRSNEGVARRLRAGTAVRLTPRLTRCRVVGATGLEPVTPCL
ncbi:MAG: aldo/keto reductase [Propionibacteriaceae bacterium]|nr:aldo/keto reductase [Propionibacteriaceae bacterium]